jgi:SMI1 / KNR4 family (SUKH-1)
MKYQTQIDRIKDKLEIAKEVDSDLKVFGASSHKYFINNPINIELLREIENKHNIVLPDCYKEFLTQVGHGGGSHSRCAAGPFYGIFPVNHMLNNSPQEHLSQPVRISPDMTAEEWSLLTAEINDDLTDEEFEAMSDQLYSGILSIGSQGCNFHYGIILNGQYKSRVVYLSGDNYQPAFTEQDNFLDWYESWLDAIISRDILQPDGAQEFGFVKTGSEQDLIQAYLSSSNLADKRLCLLGLRYKVELSPDAISFVEQQCNQDDNDIRKFAIQILTKQDYVKAKPILLNFWSAYPLTVFECILYYEKSSSEEWIEQIGTTLLKQIEQIQLNEDIDLDLLRISMLLARECTTDLSSLIQLFTACTNEKIRGNAEYTLEVLGRKG